MKTATKLLGSLAGGILATAIIAVHAGSSAGATRARMSPPANAAAPTHATTAATATTAQKPAAAAVIPAHDLKRLGSIALLAQASDDSSQPIRDVSDFTIDDRGRFGFMVGCGCERKMVVVDRDGKLVRSMDLPRPSDSSQSSRYAAWLAGDRWIVTSSSDGPGAKSSAIWVDIGSGLVTPVSGFSAPRINAIASSGDGGFVALTSIESSTSQTTHTVIAFDSKGAMVWKSPAFAADRYFAGSRSIAVTTSHHTVVLDGNTLRVYAVDGHLEHVVPIPQSGQNGTPQFQGLHADSLGGVFVDGTSGHQVVLRMSADGKSVGAFTPAFTDGHPFEMNGGVQRGPDGRTWTTDGYAFLQLDSHGRVVREVGEHFDPNRLGSIGDLAVNSNGWIFAKDRRTRAIHVFGDSGRIDHVDKAMPIENGDNDVMESMSVTDAGDVYVTSSRTSRWDTPKSRVVHYSADGKHANVEPEAVKGDEEYTLSRIAQPGTGNHWVVRFDGVLLVDAHGKQLRRIDRNSDGDTLHVAGNATVAPDGSIAVVSSVPPTFLGVIVPLGEPRTVVLLISREGIPLRTVQAPVGWEPWGSTIAFDGTHIAFMAPQETSPDKQSIVVADVQHGSRYRFQPASLDSDSKVFLLKRNGASELWIYDGKGAINRYALI